MSDTLAIHQAACPCCHGSSFLNVFVPGRLTPIGDVICAYCCGTGFIQTEVHPLGGRRPDRTATIERVTKTKTRKTKKYTHPHPRGKAKALPK